MSERESFTLSCGGEFGGIWRTETLILRGRVNRSSVQSIVLLVLCHVRLTESLLQPNTTLRGTASLTPASTLSQSSKQECAHENEDLLITRPTPASE